MWWPVGFRPALLYNEGEPLIVGKAKGSIHEYSESDLYLMLPELIGVDLMHKTEALARASVRGPRFIH